MTDECVLEFKQSLEENLVSISKPVICMLTMLAEENIEHAEQIAAVIIERATRSASKHKLPALYLIDSIMKNIEAKDRYVAAFEKRIVSTFCAVFDKVDEKVRESMHKLRQTWNGVFNAQILHQLDLSVNKLDPAWPVDDNKRSVETPRKVHVNPRFISSPASRTETPVAVVQPSPQGETDDPDSLRKILIEKQEQLTKLQEEMKLESDVAEIQAKLDKISDEKIKHKGNSKHEKKDRKMRELSEKKSNSDGDVHMKNKTLQEKRTYRRRHSEEHEGEDKNIKPIKEASALSDKDKTTRGGFNDHPENKRRRLSPDNRKMDPRQNDRHRKHRKGQKRTKDDKKDNSSNKVDIKELPRIPKLPSSTSRVNPILLQPQRGNFPSDYGYNQSRNEPNYLKNNEQDWGRKYNGREAGGAGYKHPLLPDPHGVKRPMNKNPNTCPPEEVGNYSEPERLPFNNGRRGRYPLYDPATIDNYVSPSNQYRVHRQPPPMQPTSIAPASLPNVGIRVGGAIGGLVGERPTKRPEPSSLPTPQMNWSSNDIQAPAEPSKNNGSMHKIFDSFINSNGPNPRNILNWLINAGDNLSTNDGNVTPKRPVKDEVQPEPETPTIVSPAAAYGSKINFPMDNENARLENVSDMTSFKKSVLKTHQPGVVQRLYLGFQCTNCGIRFTENTQELYASHLDGHYEKNRTNMTQSKIKKHRKWFPTLDKWKFIKDISTLKKRDDNESNVLVPKSVGTEFPVASINDKENVCAICLEPLTTFFNDEQDQWLLKDGILVGGKFYHPICSEDRPEPAETSLLVKEETAE